MSLRDRSSPVLYDLRLKRSLSAKVSLINGQPIELDNLGQPKLLLILITSILSYYHHFFLVILAFNLISTK